jgi:DNA-directed RNA polymerase subunit beta'
LDSLFSLFEKHKDPTQYSGIRIALASPDKIRSWSHGEVKKPETINYRTFKPERDGLFCAKIFGPTKDWECNCGKYKRMKHRGVVCDKCGVEVIQSKVRRERMGHIELASPVSHVWFFKSLPSRIGTILNVTLRDLERVLYFESYIVLLPGPSGLKEKELITDEKYRQLHAEFGDAFKAGMGAEAIKELLKRVDVDDEADKLRAKMLEASSAQARKKIIKRLKVLEAFRKSGCKPEWMICDVIAVIPPELRPLVPLDGGRFATSDLNDLYRRVINRNNRLKRLLELRAPDIIIRNEKRMLQEAVDALFDNGRRGRVIRGPNKRPLKSLSDMLKGKQGRFRQNLLGKRVDYSGRSVIVVGPELRLNQCGLPKKMALELFKPFIYHKLEQKGLATTLKSAKKMVEKELPEVWDALEEVTREHPVMLNRAPTLHRLGIQAFWPQLIEGKAIRLHPLVCAAFNADFDGDQMAVHIPLSQEAQTEAKNLMMSSNNILSPASGKPLAVPSQDIVLGCYYLTKQQDGVMGEGRRFADPGEVRQAYDHDVLALHAKISVRIDGKMVETTTGRVILSEVLPSELPFELVNKLMKKKELTALIDVAFRQLGRERTIRLLDDLKNTGYRYATHAGISIAIDDMRIPDEKKTVVAAANRAVEEVEGQYAEGLITKGEKYNKVIDVWAQATEKVAGELLSELQREEPRGRKRAAGFNPIFMMVDSGARGSTQQIRQLAGMRGLMAKPSGEIIETPITANFREGLTVLEYFTSTHGARKGLADTALKTANSGYLTRRLVDVAQDMIVSEDDCGTLDGIVVSSIVEGGEIIEPLKERILGRVALDDIKDPFTDEILVSAAGEITEELAEKIDESGLERVRIRSALTCEAKTGVCARCYGRDLARGELVGMGEAVGVIAAQSIGEPGTQLTMRTFHIGGTARVVEKSNHVTKNGGTVTYVGLRTIRSRDGVNIAMNRNGSIEVVSVEHVGKKKVEKKEIYPVVYGAAIRAEDGGTVAKNSILVEWDSYTNPIVTEASGKVKFGDILEGVTVKEEVDSATGLARKVILETQDPDVRPRVSIKDDAGRTAGRYLLPAGANIMVMEGDTVAAGDVIAKIPRETTKTKDITGGLPRVAELFEARKPKEQAVISEINGKVVLGGFVKGFRKVVVEGEGGLAKEYLIPKGKPLHVHDGDQVRAGEALMEGSANPHDILSVLGVKELQKYLVSEVQQVYSLQGVKINDKHIEIIVRQMLRKVVVDDVGDSEFIVGEQVDRFAFEEENRKVIESGGRPATARPILLGITRASLSTESFISAASFQETTRVLTEAAISGKVDKLRGLKENVIMGRLIPAGTGFLHYIKGEEPAPAGEEAAAAEAAVEVGAEAVEEA